MPPDDKNQFPTDTQILDLFQTEPHRAWELFIEKHADFILTVLRRAGFDYDEAMERFIYVCEKLCEKDFRRLKTVQYAGQFGDLTPWLRQVVGRLSINWVWGKEGRKRLLKPIEEMSKREQRIFQLYFWRGQTPAAVFESLRLEHDQEVEPGDVFDALEKIFSHLSEKKLWNLLSGLVRMQRPLSLDRPDEETGLTIEPVAEGVSPEQEILRQERKEALAGALAHLSAREKLVTGLRYEDTLSIADIAAILRIEPREVKNLLKSALYKLRKILG